MLLIVSIKIMMLHTDRLLPTCRLFKLLPLTGGGEIWHREKLFRRHYNARLRAQYVRRQRHHTVQNDVGGGCLPEVRSRGLDSASDLTGGTVVATPAQSFEVRGGAVPVSVPSDAGCLHNPRTD